MVPLPIWSVEFFIVISLIHLPFINYVVDPFSKPVLNKENFSISYKQRLITIYMLDLKEQRKKI